MMAVDLQKVDIWFTLLLFIKLNKLFKIGKRPRYQLLHWTTRLVTSALYTLSSDKYFEQDVKLTLNNPTNLHKIYIVKVELFHNFSNFK